MKDPNQTSSGPLVVPTGKITAQSQDFSGQDSGTFAANPAAEVASNKDSGSAGISYVNLPGERGTRKLKVYDGAAIEQLLGTRTGY